MVFKPFRDDRPMKDRPLSVQMEADFHSRIKDVLTKKQQGYVMGAFRENRDMLFNPVANTKDVHTNNNLESVISRGKYFGRIEKDGSVRINWGAASDYPEGDSILWKLHKYDIDEFIALLTAPKNQG